MGHASLTAPHRAAQTGLKAKALLMGTTQNLAHGSPGAVAPLRQCPFCGKTISRTFTQCPACRETLPDVQQPNAAPVESKRGRDRRVRRGLLYMLLAAVIHYFSGGYSAMSLPYPIAPVVTVYLSPLLFLSGLGLVIYGFLSKR
jgi:hypothetical protein